MDQPIPTVTAMLLCDQAIVEAGTNKKSLIGIFERVFGMVFPLAIPRLSVYVRIVDVQGLYPFQLRIVKLKDESLIAELKVQGKLPDAMQASELVFNFLGLRIPEEGKYEFQLYTGETYLHRVTLVASKPQGGTPWQPQKP